MSHHRLLTVHYTQPCIYNTIHCQYSWATWNKTYTTLWAICTLLKELHGTGTQAWPSILSRKGTMRVRRDVYVGTAVQDYKKKSIHRDRQRQILYSPNSNPTAQRTTTKVVKILMKYSISHKEYDHSSYQVFAQNIYMHFFRHSFHISAYCICGTPLFFHKQTGK